MFLKKIDSINPYLDNARTHSKKQIDKICKSIKRFGWTNPILIGKDSVIIAGHGRLLAAQKLGMKEVPCLDLSDMSEIDAKAYLIADNQLALEAGWDPIILKSEIDFLNLASFDLDFTGFEPLELDALLGQSSKKEKDTEILESEFAEFKHECPKCGFEFD